jgi:sulfonate transport system substrate-binding protein
MKTALVRSLGALALAALAALGINAGSASAEKAPDVVRIGYQKSSTLLQLLKAEGSIEKVLEPLGVRVEWSEFTSGLPLLEALNVGVIDLSADVADTVPLFAQAAGANLTYFAQEAPSPSGQALVVKADSDIKTVADLKGKRIGFAKAAGVHYLLIAALEKEGLSFKDITPAYLNPADGRAAFETGGIDAWVTWEPYLSAVEAQSKVRTLFDGTDLAQYQRYYLASTPFAKARPDVVQHVFEELRKTGQWVKANPAEAAKKLAPTWKLDEAIVQKVIGRRSLEVREVTRERLAEQQKIADVFFDAQLLPKKLDTSGVEIWAPVSSTQ